MQTGKLINREVAVFLNIKTVV